MKLIITLASATILSAIAAQARGAPVTWTFYETGCTLSGGPCNAQPPVPFPYQLATLILPGPTSSGTAFWQGGLPPAPAPVYTGDNFTFEYAGIFVTPAFNGEPNCLEGHGLCEFDLSWSEVGGELESIALNALSDMDQIGYRGSFGLTGGVFGSDGTVDDCFFAQCVATGFWQSNLPVPEPMTTSLLLSGLLVSRSRDGFSVHSSSQAKCGGEAILRSADDVRQCRQGWRSQHRLVQQILVSDRARSR